MATALAQPLPHPAHGKPRRGTGPVRLSHAPIPPTVIRLGLSHLGSDCATVANSILDAPKHEIDAAVYPTRCDATQIDRATLPNGTPYPGDLVTDILEYRALRGMALARGPLPHKRQKQYVTLETRLRSFDRPDPKRRHARAYHRFDLAIPARVRILLDGRAQVIDGIIENISAGGVKIGVRERPEAGERAWLILQVRGAVVVLPSRIAWARGESLGLMFAGAPKWN